MSTKVSSKLETMIGEEFIVEGTFPIPVQGGVSYAPAKGKLLAVFEEGFELQEGDESEDSTIYMFANIRSISHMKKRRIEVVKPKKIIV